MSWKTAILCMRPAAFTTCILVANLCQGAIRGTVTDSASGTPIPGATVRLSSPGEDDAVAEASSNAEGQFAFNDVEKGAYVLSASKPGYVNRFPEADRKKAVVTDRGDARLVLALTKCGVITGRILDATGRPVRSARVLAARYRGEGRIPRPDPGGPFSPVERPWQLSSLRSRAGQILDRRDSGKRCKRQASCPVIFPRRPAIGQGRGDRTARRGDQGFCRCYSLRDCGLSS